MTYICGDSGQNPEFSALDVEVVALGGDPILSAKRHRAMIEGIHNTGAKEMLERWIAANDSVGTVYHVHGWSKIMSPAVFAALAPVSHRTVLHAHDYFLACPNGSFYDYRRQVPCGCKPLATGCLTRNCDKRNYAQKLWRVARSTRVRSQLLRSGRHYGRVLLIHEGMAGDFKQAGYSDETLHALRNPTMPFQPDRVRAEDNRDFFFIGRLEPEKGILEAVAAASTAGVRLTVIGDGPLRTRVAGMGETVKVLGWLSHEEIGLMVRQARALIMPSRYPEPFGLVAVEASTSGIPVILPHTACLARDMTAAGIGLACDMGDAAQLARAVATIRDMSHDDIRRMSIRAHAGLSRLSTTPDEWRDGLLAQYLSLVHATSEDSQC
ncbi:glycosyltransferase family 4 protein (plasmid) [Aliirhizobium terrae]|uniref:glycosyltransferase family 4 protein n=1 Tax=Terrirhizobium terrae TaxID=2926709 RepID=UPI0025767A22|nr:glycosyltransferase family 4 protein [Rhizobium sp. CC-CFT758]WJH38079.1 glycosyltransferase family 4 protein [Rhizobium sp. CC-CFT758]